MKILSILSFFVLLVSAHVQGMQDTTAQQPFKETAPFLYWLLIDYKTDYRSSRPTPLINLHDNPDLISTETFAVRKGYGSTCFICLKDQSEQTSNSTPLLNLQQIQHQHPEIQYTSSDKKDARGYTFLTPWYACNAHIFNILANASEEQAAILTTAYLCALTQSPLVLSANQNKVFNAFPVRLRKAITTKVKVHASKED
jgi:hypothetical protein